MFSRKTNSEFSRIFYLSEYRWTLMIEQDWFYWSKFWKYLFYDWFNNLFGFHIIFWASLTRKILALISNCQWRIFFDNVITNFIWHKLTVFLEFIKNTLVVGQTNSKYIFIFLTGSKNQIQNYNYKLIVLTKFCLFVYFFVIFKNPIQLVKQKWKFRIFSFRIGCWIRWAREK